ncbi:MAG: aldolase/citrate lyase family protein, partial [Cyclobacteriaceae bacterium]|nr:aldolase/citrate lyase family protein [Cyclobacteriaceae bacterium]
MSGSKLLQKLKNGQNVYGTSITSSSSWSPKIIKNAGLDFVFIDTEHITFNRETVGHLCNTFKGMGIEPVVRTYSHDPNLACMALDGGASGIMAPYIETVDQVKALVGAVKYRPLKGKVLEDVLGSPDSLSLKMKTYIEERCEGNMLFINIESKPALDNLRELISVPGVDGVVIGPHDLSCSLGVPEEYESALFEREVNNIIKTCRERGMAVGIHLSEGPEHQVRWVRAGVNMVFHSSDAALFYKALVRD